MHGDDAIKLVSVAQERWGRNTTNSNAPINQPLENESIDKVLAVNVIYFLDPLDSYLREILRVLKPGGRVMFGCKFQIWEKPFFHPLGYFATRGPAFVNRTKEALLEAMARVGFDNVSIEMVEFEDNKVYNYYAVAGSKTA